MHKIATVSTILFALALSACNTVSGAGKDVSSAGHAVTKSADQNK